MKSVSGICVLFLYWGFSSALPHHKQGHKGHGDSDIDLLRFRFDEAKGKYLRLGTTADCPENMRFLAIQGNDTAGTCDCDYYECSRPLLYSDKTKQCHFGWSQGPCAVGEWYIFDLNLRGMCEPRGCNQSISEEPVTSKTVTLSFWFKYPGDGKCYESSTAGYCTEEDEFLALAPGEPIPQCRNVAKCTPIGRPEPQLCFPGNKRHFQQGKCS